jgi:hypothetical protein
MSLSIEGDCPWCGARHATNADATTDVEEADANESIEPRALAHYLKELLTRNVAHERPAKRKLTTKQKLRPGEPAQVILELKERLGDGALEGTEFADSPDVLVQVIRALEAEQQEQFDDEAATADAPHRRVQAAATADAPQPKRLAANEAAIEALRATGRELDLAADALEEHELYERADQLRTLADELRRDSRFAASTRLHDARNAIPPDHGAWRRVEPSPDETRLDLSSDIALLREELRRVRQALESRSNPPRQ